MEPEELLAVHKAYHESIANAERDPYRYGFVLDHWKTSDFWWDKYRTLLLFGANRCLAGEQVIYDPVKGKALRVDSITEDFHVTAYDLINDRFVTARALRPFQKPAQELFGVSLSNGETLFCSAAHLVLTPSGWKEVGQLAVGDCICGQPQNSSESQKPVCVPSQVASTSGIDQEAFQPSALSWSQKAQGSQSDCQSYRCSCDEQLQSAKDSSQDASPSQGGALGCISLSGNTSHLLSAGAPRSGEGIRDGLEPKRERSHFYQGFGRLSIVGDLLRRAALGAGTLFRAFCKPWSRVYGLFAGPDWQKDGWQCDLASIHLQSTYECPQLDTESNLFSCGANNTTRVSIVNIYSLRNDTVWDFEVPYFHNYVSAGIISHNSGKTSYGARAVVKAAIENHGSLIYCFSQTEETSLLVQQPAIYLALPAELKVKRTESVTHISYSSQNGFTGNALVLPNGSRIVFKFYTQFQQNQSILEGMELGARDAQWINIGAWLDEYLLGMELVDRLYLRLATRNAKLLVTFTPKDGITETVKYFLKGCETVEKRDAELMRVLHGRKDCEVPYIQKNESRNTAIIYFHSKDNPWSGYQTIVETCKSKADPDYTLTAAYGVPTAMFETPFPCFSTEVNVVKPSDIPTKGVTRYMVLDPAGRKNWFMVWIAVDEEGTFWVYREWPGVDVGEWAVEKNGDFISGPGSRGRGYGIGEYAALIRSLENLPNEVIHERIIDPRLGQTKYMKESGASSIIEDLADQDLIFLPAPALDIEDGLQALQTKMAYDRRKRRDSMNHPHFYISSECENTISALQLYTGEGGYEEAWKDPIDCLRYAAITGIYHIGDQKPRVITGKRGY